MKYILFPTDFSGNADNAFKYAYELAKRNKANLILMHVYNVPFVEPNSKEESVKSLLDSTEGLAYVKLHNQVKSVSTHIYANDKGDVNFDYVIKRGNVIDRILEVVKARKIDLIVMATKGASGLKELFIGSNTAQVIEKSTRPVLVIPEKATFHPIETIAYLLKTDKTDTKDTSYLVDFVKLFDAELKFLYIDKKSKVTDLYLLDKKVKETYNYDKISRTVIDKGKIEDEISDFLKENKPDILAMLSKERDLLSRIFNVSITRKMVHHSKVPMLVIPEQ